MSREAFQKADTPLAGDVHVNVPLTNISIAYLQDESAFIADSMFPNIPVTKQSDRYWQYSRADFNRDEMEERADGTEASGGGYDMDNEPTYFCKVYAYKRDITDRQRANQDTPLNLDRDGTIFISRKALIRRERLFATKFMTTGVWPFQLEGVASGPDFGTSFLQWSDAASTPIEDIRAAKRHVLETTGFMPNQLTLGRRVYDALMDHPDIIDRVKYGQTPGAPAMANANVLAQLFEVGKVKIADAIYNTGAKGVSYTASKALESERFIVGNHALLAYVNPAPSLMMPSAGYTFSWTGFFGASGMGSRIKKFRMENIESDRMEIQMCFDQKQVGADLACFFHNAAGVTNTTL